MQYLNNNFPFVVADIGGTNARFALIVEIDKMTGQFVIENQKTYPSATFENLDAALSHYTSDFEYEIKNACLAVAGPVTSDEIKLTNLGWQFSISDIKMQCNLDNLLLINDFKAFAFAIRYLNDSNFKSIKSGLAIDSSPSAILGVGTGFGSALLVNENDQTTVIALEGGHMSLAANTALQSAVIEYMSRRFKRISVERIFSGPGLRYLYQSLAAIEGINHEKLTTEEISQHALAGSDAMCVRTLSLFCSWLGSVAGDLALALGARGGIYIGGGVIPRIADFLIASDFNQSFVAKSEMQYYMNDIPIQLITKDDSALLGAAGWFVSHV
jgi:glucokinase